MNVRMGHFQVYLEPVLKRLLVQNLLFENKFDLHESKLVQDTFSYEWFRTKTHFDTEMKGKRKRLTVLVGTEGVKSLR